MKKIDLKIGDTLTTIEGYYVIKGIQDGCAVVTECEIDDDGNEKLGEEHRWTKSDIKTAVHQDTGKYYDTVTIEGEYIIY